MLLHSGEHLVRSAYAVLDGGGPAFPGRRPGVLYLTNRRLVFESRISRGFVRDLVSNRETEIVLDVPLEELRHLSIRPGRIRGPRLVLDLARGRPAFDLLEPGEWAGSIADARRAVPVRPGPDASGPGIGERPVVKVRCRYCGNLGQESDRRCPFCGAPL